MINFADKKEYNQEFIKQTFDYLKFGLVAMFLDFSILCFLVEFFKIYYLLSIAVAFLIASIVNFLLQKRFTFKNDNKNHFSQLSSFLLIGIIGMGINVSVVYISVEFFEIFYVLGKIFATGIVFVWNFSANKFITFRG